MAKAADAPPASPSQAIPQLPTPQSGSRPEERHQGPPGRWPGPQPDGNTLLFNQWSLHPAGRQIPLGHFPVNIAMHPSGLWTAVLHCGYRKHEIVVVDLKHQEVASRVTIPQGFYGITFDPAGKRLFASGGAFEVVHEYAFADGKLSDHRELKIADLKSTEVPAGLACSPDGKTLWVACAWGSSLARVSLDKPEHIDRLQFEKGCYPYAIVPSRDGRLFVSLWGKAEIGVVDGSGHWGGPGLGNRQSINLPASHPTEIVLSPDEKLLYVACANSNTVVVAQTDTLVPVEEIRTALYPAAPNGSTPSSLALSTDGKVLLVANSDNNNLAVFDVSQRGKSRSLGFIPTGWYPTSVRFGQAESERGQKIYVANGKGLGSRANPNGPGRPKAEGSQKKGPDEYIGGLFNGTFGIIDPPSPEDMARYSQRAGLQSATPRSTRNRAIDWHSQPRADFRWQAVKPDQALHLHYPRKSHL